MRLQPGARVGVIGAGPGGLVAAKNLLETDFEVTVFEASDGIGGQWYAAADHSGVWPGMRTNTSRAMTAFSDRAYAPDLDLHPTAEQIHAYLTAYASAFDLHRRIRLGTRVRHLEMGWRIDDEPFDAVVIASGRFGRPVVPRGLDRFTGRLLHAFDYPGVDAFAEDRILVYGNGVSGHEIAADLAAVDRVTPVMSAYRKPRYVLQKNVRGVASDWQWYTYVGVIQRRTMSLPDFGRQLREQVVRVAGNPADFGAPRPDDDILVASHSLSQDYLALVREGRIVCRPAIAGVDGQAVTFTDGTTEIVDTIISATGYHLHLPYLPDEVWRSTGPEFALYHQTIHPDLPTFAAVGQFALQGPYFPLLELQARWIAGLWSGAISPPADQTMREALRRPPPSVFAHHVLAADISETAGVAPDVGKHPELAEPLLLGPMLPTRYRLDGPGSHPDAAATFQQQIAASPRAPIDADDLAALGTLGLADLLPAQLRQAPPSSSSRFACAYPPGRAPGTTLADRIG